MRVWKDNRANPVIGLSGGIGAGKSAVARLFAAEGCAVVDSDVLSQEVLRMPDVQGTLVEWLGKEIINPDGSLNRQAIAGRVFSDPAQTERLNGMIHPQVKKLRDEQMPRLMADRGVKAVVWDAPLLFDTGLDRECDVLVFVKSPRELRLERIQGRRGWDAAELERREKLQFPLDKKAQLSDYCIDNSGDEASSLRQVQRVLSQIFDSTA